MNRRPPRSTRTDTLFPYTTLFRSRLVGGRGGARGEPLPLSVRDPLSRADAARRDAERAVAPSCPRARMAGRSGAAARGRRRTGRPQLRPRRRATRGGAGGRRAGRKSDVWGQKGCGREGCGGRGEREINKRTEEERDE